MSHDNNKKKKRKVSVHKSKLAKVMAEPKIKSTEKYRPTKDEVVKWFRIINTEVFKSILEPFDCIKIERQYGTWGKIFGHDKPNKHSELSINPWFKSKQHFISVLTHEMAHLHQWQFYNFINHGKTFQVWESIVERFNINDFN